jgi:hypothetical protein
LRQQVAEAQVGGVRAQSRRSFKQPFEAAVVESRAVEGRSGAAWR